MKAEDLDKAMNRLDPGMIEEAGKQRVKKKAGARYMKNALLFAAAAAVIGFISWMIIIRTRPAETPAADGTVSESTLPPDQSQTEMTDDKSSETSAREERPLPVLEGMSFLKDDNSYHFMDGSHTNYASAVLEETSRRTTLPVWQNLVTHSKGYVREKAGTTFEMMTDRVYEAAKSFGIPEAALIMDYQIMNSDGGEDFPELSKGEVHPLEGAYYSRAVGTAKTPSGLYIIISTDRSLSAEITVCTEESVSAGTIMIRSEGSIPVVSWPEEDAEKWQSFFEIATREKDLDRVKGWILENLSGWLPFEKTGADGFTGPSSFGGSEGFYHLLRFYEASDEDVWDRAMSNGFHGISVTSDSGYGGMAWIDLPVYDLSVFMGDYPLISAEEAIYKLEKGEALSLHKAAFPGKDKIKKIRAAYLTSDYNTYFLPFYIFSVAAEVNGENQTVDYYVPALEDRYLPDWTSWHMRAN